MDSKVRVVADAAGNVITKSTKNSEDGFIRVSQLRASFDNKGFASLEEVSALIHGKLEALKKVNWIANQEIKGKVIIREQITPFSFTRAERDLKFADDTGVICAVDGEPIYRKQFYTIDENAIDIFVEHTNLKDIEYVLRHIYRN